MQRSVVLVRASLRSSSSSSPPPLPLAFARLASTATPPPSSPHPYLNQTGASSPSPSSPQAGPSRAGPFPLPDINTFSAREREERIAQTQRKWRQLGTAQKAGVVATQGASLVVVLAGAGLVALVAYAVGSELWSEASPTRVFEDCVERVRADPELTTMLLPPLTFHGTASGTRARHRRISHSYSVDPHTGAETLFVRFWIEARDPSSTGGENESWMDWGKRWIGPAIWEDSHNPGAYQPVLEGEKKREEEERAVAEAKRREDERRRNASWFGRLGAGLSGAASAAVGGVWGGKGGYRGTRGEGEEVPGLFRRQRKPKLGEHATGEVVAELEKDRQTGHFVYKQLFVAIPDTHHPSYYRHNIFTANIIPPEEGEGGEGLNRLRFWNRQKTVVA
ncbi:hypothetical protein JCM8547_006928 [Rhodosporidiobolus lusitaniae]